MDRHSEVMEQFNALTDQQKQDLEDRYNERLRAERPSCGGKVGKLRCAFEYATWTEWLFVFGILGAFYFIRSVYEAFVTERRTQQNRDPNWLVKKVRGKSS